MGFVDQLHSFADRIRGALGASRHSSTGSELERGIIAVDRDSENKELLIMSIRNEHADEFVIPGMSQTVASYNSEYPSDDRVIEVQFVESLDAYLSEWTVAGVLKADADGTLNAGDPYYYPESRIESPVEGGSAAQ